MASNRVIAKRQLQFQDEVLERLARIEAALGIQDAAVEAADGIEAVPTAQGEDTPAPEGEPVEPEAKAQGEDTGKKSSKK